MLNNARKVDGLFKYGLEFIAKNYYILIIKIILKFMFLSFVQTSLLVRIKNKKV